MSFPRNIYRKLESDPNVKGRHEWMPLTKRFFRKVIKTEECWLWKQMPNSSGYGMFWINEFKSEVTAHRASYMIHRGEIPEGMDVLHKCDNPLCVNPEHLWAGSNLENIEDAAKKGRNVLKSQPGENNPRAILTEENVLMIRAEWATGKHTSKDLSIKFGVVPSCIIAIAARKTWKHI